MDDKDLLPSSSSGSWNHYDWVQESFDRDRIATRISNSPSYSVELPNDQRVDAQVADNDLEEYGEDMNEESIPQELGELLPFEFDAWMNGEAIENGLQENGLVTKKKTIPQDSEELLRLNFDLMGDYDEGKDDGETLAETRNVLVKKEASFENETAMEEGNAFDQANPTTEEEPAKGFEDLTVELRKKIFKLAFVEIRSSFKQSQSPARLGTHSPPSKMV
ncbi:hypothetical protein AC578_1651 [Pseudocercospora eumusae]|uniref:Uncharacterized protein n=1 Tax=Pseudocercospora eumusae TaxID=321146 RepID=A0A139HM37_9PEZI|nr:hypothetical protein AC578_1651 [Pseudocercospora eumusae]